MKIHTNKEVEQEEDLPEVKFRKAKRMKNEKAKVKKLKKSDYE